MLLDPQVRAVGVAADDAERRAGSPSTAPGDQRSGPDDEEPPPSSATRRRSDSSVKPAAVSRCATVTQTWNGDGEASMNSQNPGGWPTWFPSLTGDFDVVGSRRCPILPQPVLAPLTPAAIFLVATIDEGGEETVHDALRDISGLVRAIGFRDPTKQLSVVDLDRLRRVGPAVLRTAAAELHPFVELQGGRAPRPVDAGRSAVPHPGRVAWTSASSWRADRRGDGAAPSRSSTRCTASSSSTTAT